MFVVWLMVLSPQLPERLANLQEELSSLDGVSVTHYTDESAMKAALEAASSNPGLRPHMLIVQSRVSANHNLAQWAVQHGCKLNVLHPSTTVSYLVEQARYYAAASQVTDAWA